ncbi:hydroxyethylthiazole kinase [Peptoniphilus sp. GNH]|nr:hydroxyethylthiazole kinase [Peptoniphilus sp. GNH]
MKNLREILKIRDIVRKKQPLIHAITNPLAINMLANAILFQGARPICAEHPDEMKEIVSASEAVSVNLGNITDARLKSISLAANIANEKSIPILIDLVGIGASKLRLNFAKKILQEHSFNIIKGNSSEILSLSSERSNAKGVDVGEADEIDLSNLEKMIQIASLLSNKYKSAILITGKIDILLKGSTYYLISNGCKELANITATGCMLSALISVFMPFTDELEASLLGLLILEIAAEISKKDKPYSFFVNLMDNIALISDDVIEKRARIKEGIL